MLCCYYYQKIPKQTNSIDCGVFVLKFTHYLSANKRFDFNQEQMEIIRKRIFIELAT